MAVKKFLDLQGLASYDAKVKALIADSDATILANAKKYCDDKDELFDAAGSATTALTSAKSYTDTEVAKANSAAAAAKSAADAAQAAADAAQGDVDTLEGFVGTLPEGETSATVIAYIDKKTSGIASESVVSALAGRMDTAEQDITGLKGRMDTAEGNIGTLQTQVSTAQAKADANEGKLTTLIGTDANKSVRAIANEELVAQLVPETAAESLDTLQEIAQWIQSHPDDASAMSKAIDDLEVLVGTIPAGVTATNVTGYIAEVKAALEGLITAEKTRAEGAEGALDGRLDAVELKLNGTGDGSLADLVADAKQEAITAAAADATTKANTAKSDAITAANAYTDTEVGKVEATVTGIGERLTTAEGEIDTLQAASHTHANATVLNGITAANVTAWSDAATKAHTHANATVLDGITAAKVTAWDNSLTSANSYTDEKIAEFTPVTTAEIDSLFV